MNSLRQRMEQDMSATCEPAVRTGCRRPRSGCAAAQTVLLYDVGHDPRRAPRAFLLFVSDLPEGCNYFRIVTLE